MRSGMNKASAVLLLIVGVFIVSVPMFAHHGTNISYDRSKPVTMQGTVTEFRFANPHQLILSGWTKQRSTNELKPGTVVTITVAPSRAGTNAALLLKVVNDKGQELLATGPDSQQ